MTKERLYRLEVTPNAYHIIEAEAFLSGRTLKSIASEIISEHSSKEAKSLSALKHKDETDKEPDDHMIIAPESIATEMPKDQKTMEGAAIDSIKPHRKKRLADNPDALARIKTLWNSGQKNQAEISRQIGYHRATVNDNIQRLLESGEITK
jgi:hypothetical protein